MIDLYLLEYLLAFYQEGSLLKASEKLHLSQPSLTRSMQKLESQLEIALFDRKANKITLNENGLMVVEYAKDILAMQEKLLQKAKEIKQNNKIISVAFTAPGPRFRFPHFFMHPQDKFIVSTTIEKEDAIIKGVLNNLYDLGFINHPLDDENLVCKKVMDEHLYIALPPNHFLAKMNQGVYFKDVDGQSFLLLTHLGVWDDILDKHLSKSRLLHQNDQQDLKEIISFSSIPSFVTNWSKKFNAFSDRVLLPFLDEDATIPFYVICKKKKQNLLSYLK